MQSQDIDQTGVEVPKTELSQHETDKQLQKMNQFFATDKAYGWG